MMHSSLFIFTLFTTLAAAEPSNNTYFRHAIRAGQHFSHPPDFHPNKSTALSKVPSQEVSPEVESLFSICIQPVFTVTATVTTFCDPETHSTPTHGKGANSTYSGLSSRPETASADFNAHRLPVTTHLLPSVIFRNTTIFSTKSVVATITRTTVIVDTLTKTKVYAHTTIPLPTSTSEKEYTDGDFSSSFVSNNRSSQSSLSSQKLSQTKTLQPDPSVTNDSIDELLKLLSHTPRPGGKAPADDITENDEGGNEQFEEDGDGDEGHDEPGASSAASHNHGNEAEEHNLKPEINYDTDDHSESDDEEDTEDDTEDEDDDQGDDTEDEDDDQEDDTTDSNDHLTSTHTSTSKTSSQHQSPSKTSHGQHTSSTIRTRVTFKPTRSIKKPYTNHTLATILQSHVLPSAFSQALPLDVLVDMMTGHHTADGSNAPTSLTPSSGVVVVTTKHVFAAPTSLVDFATPVGDTVLLQPLIPTEIIIGAASVSHQSSKPSSLARTTSSALKHSDAPSTSTSIRKSSTVPTSTVHTKMTKESSSSSWSSVKRPGVASTSVNAASTKSTIAVAIPTTTSGGASSSSSSSSTPTSSRLSTITRVFYGPSMTATMVMLDWPELTFPPVQKTEGTHKHSSSSASSNRLHSKSAKLSTSISTTAPSSHTNSGLRVHNHVTLHSLVPVSASTTTDKYWTSTTETESHEVVRHGVTSPESWEALPSYLWFLEKANREQACRHKCQEWERCWKKCRYYEADGEWRQDGGDGDSRVRG